MVTPSDVVPCLLPEPSTLREIITTLRATRVIEYTGEMRSSIISIGILLFVFFSRRVVFYVEEGRRLT